MRIPCFCIKELVLDFKYLDQDTFIIEDNSIHEGLDRDKMNSDYFTAKVTTPQKEEFFVNVPANGRVAVRRSDNKLMKMVDGTYCVEVESCTDKLTREVLYSYNLGVRIKGLLAEFGMNEDYLAIDNMFKHMKLVAEFGQSEKAKIIFDNIKRLLSECEMRKM